MADGRCDIADIKGLPVPADATGEGTAGGAAGVAIVEIALDGPVVRDIESAPMGIVILRTGHLSRVAQNELPVVIKTNSLSGITSQRAEYYNKSSIDETVVAVALIE